MGGENAVVQHEIDARARSQGGELFEEFQGLEEEVARAIVLGALELQQDATVPGEPKTGFSLTERRLSRRRDGERARRSAS